MQDSQKSARKLGLNLFGALNWVLAILVITSGIVARMHLPAPPMMDKDSGSFLNPALSLYETGVLQLEQGRSYPYPVLLALILRVFKSYNAIAFIHHLLGVLAGVLGILAWNRARLLIRSPAVPEPIYRIIGLLPVYLFLSSSKCQIYEQLIRPEAVMPFFFMGTIFFGIQFMIARFVEDRPYAALGYATALIFTSALVFVMKAIWGLNLLFTSLPVIVSLFRPAQQPAVTGLSRFGELLLRRILPIALPVLLSALVLFWPDRVLRERDPLGKLFLPTSLFSIHADIICDQLGDDVQKNDTPYPTEELRSVLTTLAQALKGPAAAKMGSLDFNADYLLHSSSFFSDLSRQFGGNQPMASFCMYYYKRAFAKRPRQMGGKILQSMRVFYCLECPLYEAEKRDTAISDRYKKTLKLFGSHLAACKETVCQVYAQGCEQVARSHAKVKASKFGRLLFKPIRASYLPTLFLALGLCAILFALKCRSLGLFGAMAVLLFSLNFGMCLGVSVVHTLGIRRYIHCQYSFTVFAQFFALALVLEAAAQLGRKWLRPGNGEAEAEAAEIKGPAIL